MVNKRILALCCMQYIASMYGMDYEFKDKQLFSKPIERTISRQVTLAAPQMTVAVQKASASPYDAIAPVAIWINDPKQPEQEQIDQTVQLTKYECMSMPLTEQVQMIEQLQVSLDQAKEALAGLKRLQGKSCDLSLKHAIDCNERSIRISQEQIKACSCICAKTIQTQLARCQDSESKLALMKTLNTVHAKFKDNVAAKEIVQSCESALVTLQGTVSEVPQQAAGTSSKQEYSEERVLKTQEQIRADERQAVLEFSTALNEKYSLCKTLQAKAKLIFELLALQEQLAQEGGPQGIIGLCETKINICALNIRRELSALPQSRPDWLYDSHVAKLTGNKPIEHAWQNFQTAVRRIKKCFTELIENKGALSSVRIEQLYRAKAACQDLEARINDVCRFGSDQVSSQDMSVTCKEREQLESTCEKLIAITELYTKHMKVLPEAAPQQYYSSSYHEESESGVAQEETMLARNKPKIIGALGGLCGSGLLNYCGINATLAIAWGTGVMTVSGGVGLCIGGVIWAALEVKRQLDRHSQTEVHIKTPVSTHVYKIGEPEPDMAETFAYIRKQQALQQSSLSQPGRADDAVLQADGVTLLPKEAVQQPAKPAEAPSALVPTDKQLDKQQDKLSGKDSAKEESISITEGQIQGAMQIPIQREVLATTPGGSIPVETVSAEELKQYLAIAGPLLTEKANQLEAAGNASIAKELRAGAEYAKECLKLYGQATLAQFSKDTIGLFKSILKPELRQIGLQQEEPVATCVPEQKYKDTVQELCAKAGCKTGSILHQVCIALITQGVGQAIQSLPPINPTPQAVLVGGQGTVAVPVASTVADTVELTGGVLLMNGQQGSGGDASGSHDEAPQASSDEKDAVQSKPDVSAKSSREVIMPKVQTFEQARNKAFDIIGDAMGCDSKPLIGGMEKSAGFGKVIGRISADRKVQWRLDWDPGKGMHIHVDNFRDGKGLKAKEYVIPFDGEEQAFISLLKNLNR